MCRAIQTQHGVPEKITIDKSGANTAAIVSLQADTVMPIELRQSKYLNNLVEQDHLAVKRITPPDRCLASRPFVALES